MRKLKKALAVILALTMIVCVSQVSSLAGLEAERAVNSLAFAHMSDLHYYPESLMGSKGSEWLEFCRLESKMYNESETIIRTALDTLVERSKTTGVKYVLLSGDLTKDGEYEAHVGLAKILKEYQDKYGLKFFVCTGNHDINQQKACTFENDEKQSARSITPDEFREVYAEFGYNFRRSFHYSSKSNPETGVRKD